MSEINIDALIRRAQMLEQEKDFQAALAIYNKVLETEPENEFAYGRTHAIKYNTLHVVKEPLPIMDPGSRYFLTIDGVRITDTFLCPLKDEFTVTIVLGRHRIAVWAEGFDQKTVAREIISFNFDITEKEQTLYLRYTKADMLHFSLLAEEAGKKGAGCYVATAVYGSYDCPEVWTLRRFRDNTLASTFLGRLFILLYYAISPTLVKWFGDSNWFKMMWKPVLDKMIRKLNINGVENTPYDDQEW